MIKLSWYSWQIPFKYTWVYSNEVTSGKFLRMELIARGTNPVIRGLELSVRPPWLSGWRWTQLANNQWFNQSCLCIETSIKPKKDVVWRASRYLNIWRLFQDSDALWEHHTYSHKSCPIHLFHLAVPELLSFTINWQYSKMFLCVQWATLTNLLSLRWESWEPLI